MTDNSSKSEAKTEADIFTSRKRKIKNISESYTEKMKKYSPNPSSSGHETQSDVVIIRYGELALKSAGVRNWYEKNGMPTPLTTTF